MSLCLSFILFQLGTSLFTAKQESHNLCLQIMKTDICFCSCGFVQSYCFNCYYVIIVVFLWAKNWIVVSTSFFNYSTVSKLFTPLQVFFTVQSFVVLANAVYAYASITVN